MANQSEKKAHQLYLWYKKTYTAIVAALFLWFILIRIVWCWDSFNFINMVGFVIFAAANFFGLKFLFFYLEYGHPRSSYSLLEECLWVVWFVMFMSVFTGYAWLIFLTIPGYLLYTYSGTISSFWNARNQQQQQQQQAQLEQMQQMQMGQHSKRR